MENGAAALNALAQKTYHAVFLDIQMPVMDGLETVQAIRQGKAGKATASIPVFALTAYAMKGDEENFMEKGMDGYLSKPINVESLQSTLDTIASMPWQKEKNILPTT